MNNAIVEICKAETESLVGRINTNMRETGTDATGKTSRSFHYNIGEKNGGPTVELSGRPFFPTVETGRRPTPEKRPSRAMIENIEDWVSARGLDESMVWAIAVKINNEGTELWKKGGRKDIYSNELPGFVNSLGDKLAKYYADRIVEPLTGLS